MSNETKNICHQYTVDAIYSKSSGLQLSERWFMEDGTNGRPDGKPSFRAWDEKTGLLKYEEYKDPRGHFHRTDGGPASIEYDESGKTETPTLQKWYQNDKMMREGDLPSEVVTDAKTGVDVYIRFTDDYGRTFRGSDYPAIIKRNVQTGDIWSEHFDGVDGPIIRPN